MFNYLNNKDLEINIINNKLYVINYTNVDSFSREKIKLKYEKGIIIVNGDKLVISKLLKDEILISGEIKSIEFG